MKMKITLTPTEVEKILETHLLDKFQKVGKIEIEVRNELRGTQMQEYQQAVFKGVSAEVEV